MRHPGLSAEHLAMLRASGLSDETIEARGYRTVTSKAELKRLGFGPAQLLVPTLLVPIFGVGGEVVLYQHRPDHPRVKVKNGKAKAIKYETPRGARMALDVPPHVRAQMGDPAVPLIITEGVKKADAAVSRGLCCIALLGVWNFRGTNPAGGKVVLPDWGMIALNGRAVYIAFDSDIMEKAEVYRALVSLKEFLDFKKAHTKLIYLPPGGNGSKVGLDDFLAAGSTTQDLFSYATSELRRPPSSGGDDMPYEMTETGIVWMKATRDGAVPVSLTNFGATISAEIDLDDGQESRKQLEIEATLKGRSHRLRILAEEFPRMGWVLPHLGAGAIISAGIGAQDRAREAIQRFSPNIERHRVFAHTGWTKIDGAHTYLHAGGAIGANGPVDADVEVMLPDRIQRFELPPPARDLGEARRAIGASLGILDTAPDRITVPLLGAVARAVLDPPPDFGVFVAGPSGARKTELTALVQRHFGRTMDRLNLPGAWTSTENALEDLAFTTKNAIFVIDDFAPRGTQQDIQRLHQRADRLFRAQGNGAGRQRMKADMTLRKARPPRGLLVASGEDVPRGHSLRGRLLILELHKDAVDLDRLTASQHAAAEGLFTLALSGFVSWLAPRLDDVRAHMSYDAIIARTDFGTGGLHARTPVIVTQLQDALGLYMDYSTEVGAVSHQDRSRYLQRFRAALAEIVKHQPDQQSDAEPAKMFVRYLASAITTGRAHLVAPSGGVPSNAESYGWRKDGFNEWRPLGELVGWIEGQELFLDTEAAYVAAQKMGRDSTEALTVGASVLKRRLREQGWLLSVDTRGGVERLEVRRTLSGIRRPVLHLHISSLFDEEDAPGEVAHVAQVAQVRDDDDEPGPFGPVGPRHGERSIEAIRFEVAGWSVSRREEWAERAGIMEHDGAVSRDAAERHAWEALRADEDECPY